MGTGAREFSPKAILDHEPCDTVLTKNAARESGCLLKDFRMGVGLPEREQMAEIKGGFEG